MTDKFQKMAEATLKDFVNDHNETVRWLRNQNPDDVADALAAALQSLSSSLAKKFLDAVPEKNINDYLMGSVAYDQACGWNAARSKLLEVIKSEGIEVNP